MVNVRSFGTTTGVRVAHCTLQTWTSAASPRMQRSLRCVLRDRGYTTIIKKGKTGSAVTTNWDLSRSRQGGHHFTGSKQQQKEFWRWTLLGPHSGRTGAILVSRDTAMSALDRLYRGMDYGLLILIHPTCNPRGNAVERPLIIIFFFGTGSPNVAPSWPERSPYKRAWAQQFNKIFFPL